MYYIEFNGYGYKIYSYFSCPFEAAECLKDNLNNEDTYYIIEDYGYEDYGYKEVTNEH